MTPGFFIFIFTAIYSFSNSQTKGNNNYMRKSVGKTEELLSHLSLLAKTDSLRFMYYNVKYDTADLKYHHLVWQIEKILETTQVKDETIKLWYT